MSWFCGFFVLLFAPDGDQALSQLKKEILNLTKHQKAVYGIAFRNRNTGEELLINADDWMHAASTMKTPVMMRLFELAQKGDLRLKDPILLSNRFHSIVDGSLFSIEGEEDPLLEKIGARIPLVDLIHAMITRSSNLATNLLIDTADPKETTKLMHRFGAKDIQILRGVQDLLAYEAGLNNRSTARAMMHVMIACADSPYFTEESRLDMLAILREQYYVGVIPAGLPKDSGAKIANKTGAISTVEHDAAIIDLPDGNRYCLVIFARDFGDERTKVRETGRHISKLVYEHVLKSGAQP